MCWHLSRILAGSSSHIAYIISVATLVEVIALKRTIMGAGNLAG